MEVTQYLFYLRLYLKSDQIRNIVFGSMINFETKSDTEMLYVQTVVTVAVFTKNKIRSKIVLTQKFTL